MFPTNIVTSQTRNERLEPDKHFRNKKSIFLSRRLSFLFEKINSLDDSR